MVQEDWKKLIICYGVKGEEGISYKVYDRLAGEDFRHGRAGEGRFGIFFSEGIVFES